MAAYATYLDVERGFRKLTEEEIPVCNALLDEVAILIDAYASNVAADVANLVSCRVVRRALGSGTEMAFPLGATQGTVSAGGYSQSWTLSGGSTGELYLSKVEKKLLGVGNSIGSAGPLTWMTEENEDA